MLPIHHFSNMQGIILWLFPPNVKRFRLVQWAGSSYISRFGTEPNSIGPWSLHMSRSRFGWMDGWVSVLSPFNSISVISRRWKGEYERLCAMKRRLGLGRISPPAGFEPATPWSELGQADASGPALVRTKFLVPKDTVYITSFGPNHGPMRIWSGPNWFCKRGH